MKKTSRCTQQRIANIQQRAKPQQVALAALALAVIKGQNATEK